MCGILAEIRPRDAVDRPAFERMTDTLAHRGPDGRGTRYLSGGRVALGHRRLAVIDLSDEASQPLANETGDRWLVFNGEIYNFAVLREELESLGHRFRSKTDSEVILHGYEEWGEGVVRKLRGIFAFVVWDETAGRGLAARDHFGVKPLYYGRAGGALLFASQPRVILAHPDASIGIDKFAFARYLAHRYVPGGDCIYDGIDKLPPGHFLTFEHSDAASPTLYWAPRYEPSDRGRDDLVAAVREGFGDAVRSQLVSDVPVGCFLSGGVDSTAVLAAARGDDARDAVPPSFTIGIGDLAFDERRDARRAAELLGSKNTVDIYGAARFRREIGEFIARYDEPFFDYSGAFVGRLAEMARGDGVPVVLCGDGGDELFAGYQWHDPGRPRPERRLARLRERLLPPRASDPIADYFAKVGYFDRRGLARVAPGLPEYDPVATLSSLAPDDVPAVTRLQLIDMQTFLPDDILTKVDFATMAHGVEARVPLLDVPLAERALTIPAELQRTPGRGKLLFRDAMAGVVPGEMLTDRKKGFGVPIGRWFTGPMTRSLLRGGVLESEGLIDPRAVGPIDRRFRGELSWLLAAAELWAVCWLAGEGREGVERRVVDRCGTG